METLFRHLRSCLHRREIALSLPVFPIVILLSPTPSARAAETLNPQETRITERADCHTDGIHTRGCRQGDGSCLVAQPLDRLSLLCRIKEECCRPGQDTQSRFFLGRKAILATWRQAM